MILTKSNIALKQAEEVKTEIKHRFSKISGLKNRLKPKRRRKHSENSENSKNIEDYMLNEDDRK
jgi:hypothetical protein